MRTEPTKKKSIPIAKPNRVASEALQVLRPTYEEEGSDFENYDYNLSQ